MINLAEDEFCFNSYFQCSWTDEVANSVSYMTVLLEYLTVLHF